jgi:hypothetical protein
VVIVWLKNDADVDRLFRGLNQDQVDLSSKPIFDLSLLDEIFIYVDSLIDIATAPQLETTIRTVLNVLDYLSYNQPWWAQPVTNDYRLTLGDFFQLLDRGQIGELEFAQNALLASEQFIVDFRDYEAIHVFVNFPR